MKRVWFFYHFKENFTDGKLGRWQCLDFKRYKREDIGSFILAKRASLLTEEEVVIYSMSRPPVKGWPSGMKLGMLYWKILVVPTLHHRPVLISPYSVRKKGLRQKKNRAATPLEKLKCGEISDRQKRQKGLSTSSYLLHYSPYADGDSAKLIDNLKFLRKFERYYPDFVYAGSPLT